MRPPLHPQMTAALAKAGELDRAGPDAFSLPIDELRRLMAESRRYWNVPPVPLAEVRDLAVPGPFRSVPARLFRPTGRGDGRAVFYLHGGGWVQGSIDTHEPIMRGLAAASGCLVLGIEYAKAPERPFPAPVEETEVVYERLSAMADELGFDRNRVAVAGDSSGANVALAAAIEAIRRVPGLIKAGMFFYGVFDADVATESHRQFGDGSAGLTTDRMDWYWSRYVLPPARREDPRASLTRADLRGLFPMYLVAAECDVLRDDTLRLAHALDKAGVCHRLDVRKGMAHGFMNYGLMVDDAKAVFAEAAEFLAEEIGESD